MTTLPLTGSLLKAYNNLPAIPQNDPLGNILNQLAAAALAPAYVFANRIAGGDLAFDGLTALSAASVTPQNRTASAGITLNANGTFNLVAGTYAFFAGVMWNDNVALPLKVGAWLNDGAAVNLYGNNCARAAAGVTNPEWGSFSQGMGVIAVAGTYRMDLFIDTTDGVISNSTPIPSVTWGVYRI